MTADEGHQIRFSSRGARDLERLPRKVAEACVAFIFGALSENPRLVGKPLLGEFEGMLSARRGSYRIVYRIDDERKVVEIARVAHRSRSYGH